VLTADLVRARRKGEALVLAKIDGKQRRRALELAEELIAMAEEHVGEPRGALLESWRAIAVGPREHKLAEGLKKLLLDRAEFEAEGEHEPAALREAVFLRASAARAALGPGEAFDRDAVLHEVGAELGLEPSTLDRLLYADLREAHPLLRLPPTTPAELVAAYELGQAQAVLLRAESVVVDVTCRAPGAYRALFRKLKFLRLLHTLERRADGSYRVAIDGPYSLFASVTKYGLALALLLPALRQCDRFTLRAVVRWGKAKERLRFELDESLGARARGDEDGAPPLLADEVAELLGAFTRRGGPWEAAPSTELLDLPGVGTCVPDLDFVHRETGEVVHLEVLGYWSRDAVFRRVELAEAGLPSRVLFAVPARLRVSEAVLEDPLPAALHVYKGKLLPGPVEAKLDALSGRKAKTK
jgi:predicted nuclease of restriction endonuclease-like RecB superfamily